MESTFSPSLTFLSQQNSKLQQLNYTFCIRQHRKKVSNKSLTKEYRPSNCDFRLKRQSLYTLPYTQSFNPTANPPKSPAPKPVPSRRPLSPCIFRENPAKTRQNSFPSVSSRRNGPRFRAPGHRGGSSLADHLSSETRPPGRPPAPFSPSSSARRHNVPLSSSEGRSAGCAHKPERDKASDGGGEGGRVCSRASAASRALRA